MTRPASPRFTENDGRSATDEPSLSPFAPEWLDDPYPLYGRLREIGHVVRIDDWFWAVTTAEAVHAALRDHERLGNANPHYERQGRKLGPALQAFKEMLVQLDEPEHRPQRQLLSAPFTPARLAALEPLIRQVVSEGLDQLAGQGPRCDFAEHFAHTFPLTMFTRLLGIPKDDQPQIMQWAGAWVTAIGRGLNRERVMRADEGMTKFMSYMDKLADERSTNPGDDLLSALLAAEEDGRFLSRRQLLVQTVGLVVAGSDSTAHTMLNGLVMFRKHPEQWELLCQEPELAGSAMDEILRYDPVAQHVTRTVREDFEFFGTELTEGESVTVLTASANRDPELYEDPDRFDITRPKSSHFTFGGGRHFCLGAALSRRESVIALRGIIERFPKLRIAGTPQPFRTGFMRGYRTMPVEF